MITIENEGNRIYEFGRIDNNPTVKVIDNFYPYFYAETLNGEFISIDNKKIAKIICDYPGEVKELRKNYKNTYEADVLYVNRYIIDKKNDMPKQTIRILYFDIEIERTEKGYSTTEEADNPILSISSYDSFEKKYINLCLNKTHNTEKELLEDFILLVQKYDPDIMVAWNGNGFDFPFIINRINKLGLNANRLSRLNKKSIVNSTFQSKYAGVGRNKSKIFGRVLFDLMEGYKKISQGGRESWSLDYISQYEGVGEKEKYKGELDDLFKEDIEKFIQYNNKDVELLVLLNEKLNIIDFFDEVRRLCFCRIEDVFMNSKIADCLCIKESKYPLPSVKQHNQDETFAGAFVHEAEPKLHNNIAVFDMRSLYPSVILGFNTSYETLLPEDNGNCINVDNKFFYKKETGLIPSIVRPLLDKRNELKVKMKQTKYGSREYKTADMTQYALKVIANSFYGILGYKNFRLYNRNVAYSITYISQIVIKEVIRWFEEREFNIIYGDTDSIFVEMKDATINQMNEFNNQINKYFKDYFLQYGVLPENNIFELEFEKVFSKVFFKRKADGKGTKKKYAGRLIFKDGKEVDELSITGFESKRSDNPQKARDFLKQVLKMIVYDNEKEDIDKYVTEFRELIKNKFTPEEIALPIGIQKELSSYGNQIHAVAARNGNDNHNLQIKKGDKIKYIFIKHPTMKVIGFKADKYMPEGYEIDYDKVLRRLVDLKVGPIYTSLGWEYKYMSNIKIIRLNVRRKKLKQLVLF